MRYLLVTLLLFFSQVLWAESAVTHVRVLKNDHKLQLLSGDRLVHEFHVVFGANPKGHKMEEGDERTPEGSYILDYKKLIALSTGPSISHTQMPKTLLLLNRVALSQVVTL